MKYFLLILLLTGTLAAAEFSPWDAWRQGYSAYEKGEESRNKGDYVKAMSFFQQALDNYLQVKKNRPDWNQNIISARISECEKAISEIRKLMGASDKPAVTLPRETGTTGGGSGAGESALQAEIERYKQKLFEAMVELEDARKQIKENQVNAAEIDNLMRERRVMQEKYSLLNKKYEDLEKQALEPDSRLESMRKQLVEEKLNSEIITKKLQLAEAKAAKLEADSTDLYKNKLTSDAAKKQSEENAARLERELVELRRFQTTSLQRTNELLGQVKEQESAIKDYETKTKSLTDELDSFRKRQQELLKTGGTASSLNTELLEENQKLRNSILDAQSQTATTQNQMLTVQNRNRDLQLEIAQLKELTQRIDSARARLEDENKTLKANNDKISANQELVNVELKNLRERNRQLEADIASWSQKYDNLAKRLKEKDDAAYQSYTQQEKARKDLLNELDNLKLSLADLKTQNDSLTALKTQLETNAAETQKAMTTLRAENLGLSKRLDDLTQYASLKDDYEKLKLNFTAVQADNRNLADKVKSFEEESKNLQNYRDKVAELGKVQLELTRLQQENQKLQTENVKLKNQPPKIVTVKETVEVPAAADKPKLPGKLSVKELLERARRAENEEKLDSAVWYYREVLVQEPNQLEANTRVGEIMLAKEDYSNAADYLRQSLNANPNQLNVKLSLAKALNATKKYGNTIELLHNELQKAPNSGDIMFPYAIALANSGNPTRAEQMFNSALLARPEDPAILLELARVIVRNAPQRNDEAAQYYRQAKKLGAKDTELDEKLKSLLDQKQELNDFLLNAAMEAEKNKDFTSAIWYFKQLAEADKSNTMPVAKLAWIQHCKNNDPAALEIIELNPPSPYSLLIKALIVYRGGDAHNAEVFAQEAVKANGGQPLNLSAEWQDLRKELTQTVEQKADGDSRGAVEAMRKAFR